MPCLQQRQDIQLLPYEEQGKGFEPLFKTQEEYEEFENEFYAAVTPCFKENARKRAESELASISQAVI